MDRPRRTPGEPIGAYRARLEAYVAAFRRGPSTPVAAMAPAPVRQVRVGGKAYDIAAADSLALFGALALAVDGETASITLASGDVLILTHQEVSDLGRQLAGTPADEVSG